MNALVRGLAAALVLLAAGCASRRAEIPPPAPAPPMVAAPVPEPAPEVPEPIGPPPATVEAPPPAPEPPAAAPAPEEPARPAPRPAPPPVARPATPAVPEPPPTPPPVVAARVPHQDQIAQEVNTRLTRTQDVVGKIDPSKLTRDQREIFSGILDFISKAKEAYQAKDFPRAQVLADKASKLADDLAQAVKR